MDSSVEEIYNLVKKKMQEQGAFDREAYRNFVSEAIFYYHEKGRLTDDDNEEFIEKRMMDMYELAKDEVSEGDEKVKEDEVPELSEEAFIY